MTEPSYLTNTRAGYDAIAADYADQFGAELGEKPLGRAMLTAFAEFVQAAGDRPVADLGCGPGRVTAYLSSFGLTTFGIDLSPAMVTLARQAHPGLRFDEGSMTALDLADGVIGGIVAWYSIIHTPPESLPVVFQEFHRVLVSGGYLLLAFQVGDEPLHRRDLLGHTVSLLFYRLSPDRISDLLTEVGFTVQARLVREPDQPETVQHAYLLARKPAA